MLSVNVDAFSSLSKQIESKCMSALLAQPCPPLCLQTKHLCYIALCYKIYFNFIQGEGIWKDFKLFFSLGLNVILGEMYLFFCFFTYTWNYIFGPCWVVQACRSHKLKSNLNSIKCHGSLRAPCTFENIMWKGCVQPATCWQII